MCLPWRGANCVDLGDFAMIHEIGPRKFLVAYRDLAPEPGDTVFVFDGDSFYCRFDGGEIVFPTYGELGGAAAGKFLYLFSIDDDRYFMPDVGDCGSVEVPERYERQGSFALRSVKPRHLAFAAVTAQELYLWYMSNRFCGSCGEKTAHSSTERACICTKCGLVAYPKISPVVIVAVRHGERLLVTRYKDRPFKHYALVAGFAEIGESLEDTVRREVFEETGVRVKNIRYYKSQPWGFSSSLLSGFFCDLDGDPEIVVDDVELSEAEWLHRDEIPPADNDISLTGEMMEKFRTASDC